MNRLDKYGFNDPLKEIGIDNIFDIEALRKKCDSLIINVKAALHEKNKIGLNNLEQRLKDLEDKKSKAPDELIDEYDKRIDSVKKEIKIILDQRDKWYRDFDQTSALIHSTDDISTIVYHIIKLSSSYLLLKPKTKTDIDPKEEEYKKVVNDLSFSLKNPEDVRQFLVQKVFICNYIDTEQRDLSRFEYTGNGETKDGYPEYIYAAKPHNEPQKIIDIVDEVGDRVQAYNIGRFAFGKFFRDEHYTYNSGVYNLLTILRCDKDGNIKRYNGVLEENYNEVVQNPNFYGLVVFSDLVMENAEENNFGYIGKVVTDDEGQKRLVFDGNIEYQDLVTALSYAHKFPGRIIGLPKCNTLPEFYEIMNERVMRITDIEKPITPEFDDDEGRK